MSQPLCLAGSNLPLSGRSNSPCILPGEDDDAYHIVSRSAFLPFFFLLCTVLLVFLTEKVFLENFSLQMVLRIFFLIGICYADSLALGG